MLSERVRQMEADLERIAGVHSARIQAEDGEISEVHVVSDPARRPKWIVRDVITTLFARHGVRIPHQRISVAGSAPVPAAAAAAEAPRAEESPGWRLRVSAVHLGREGDRLRATVELRDGNRVVRASAEAMASRSNHTRVVAEATLEAVRKLTAGMMSLDLEGIRRVRMGRIGIVLAHVVLLRAEGERSLIGSCPDGVGRLEAPAGAVLDAVNRVLQSVRVREDEVEYEVDEEGRA